MKSWKCLTAAASLVAGLLSFALPAGANIDTTPPDLVCPGNIEVTAELGATEVVVTFEVSVTDTSGSVSVSCDHESGSLFPLGTTLVTCDAQDFSGNSTHCQFEVIVLTPPPEDPGNDVWPRAMTLPLVDELGVLRATQQQALTGFDQSRWYRFPITPGSRVVVTLTHLPANYDLALFKDIEKAYRELVTPSDLPLIDAEFADDAFSPAQFSPAQFSPAQFSPAAFSPAQFSPAQFSPAQFSPAQFSPAQFSPAQFSPDAFSPAQFSPAQFSPAQFSPAQFSPAQFSPAQFSPAQFSELAYAGAQMRSIIAVSAFEGTADEGVYGNTWNEDTYFYIRVRGRQGAFDAANPFQVDVYVFPGDCLNVTPVPVDGGGQPLPPSTVAAPAGGYRTLILTDLGRLPGTPAAKADLMASLQSLAARPEVQGRVIDVGTDAWVAFFNHQADVNLACSYAKNLVGDAIRAIVDRSRAGNALEYLVLAGDDSVIPFFRYQDEALLGPEEQYIPPVQDSTSSQAALRRNFFLSQDRYGAECEVSRKGSVLPVPGLAVGRLVESPAEIGGMISAYLETAAGVLPPPSSVLVTGYDFLADVAGEVAAELHQGTGVTPDRLIAPAHIAPLSPESWTANDLRRALLDQRHDIGFLAGHFSAGGALAADYATAILARELTDATALDLKNSLFYSAGCHSGYNVVDAHAVGGTTVEPDWAQAMARKQATLVAGTGYQYGDTDFIEYSERLYLGFTRRLRTGAGPVSIGKALMAAKREYLASTPDLRGIHEKALLQATLFGLPMLSVNFPAAGRAPVPSDTSIVGVPSFYVAPDGDPQSPGQQLGLRYADVTVNANLTRHQMVLTNADFEAQVPPGPAEVTAIWYSGTDGISSHPAEPVLPLELRNVEVAGLPLRGIGFREGDYADETGVVPLTGAATTEIRGVHPAFLSDVLFPPKFWRANYYGGLCGGVELGTRLVVTPLQFRSDPGVSQGTLRRYPRTQYRLFYSANVETYDDLENGLTSTPALSSAPSISQVSATVEGTQARFSMQVVGNPAAGIQEVWVTYTAVAGPFAGAWRSLDLVQNSADSRVWEGALELGATPSGDFRFFVQAVNGVGLVAFASNLGAYYIPGRTGAPDPSAPSTVQLVSPPNSGNYGTQVELAGRLRGGGSDLAGRLLVFRLGGIESRALTGADGVARTRVNLLQPPGSTTLRVDYAGAADFGPSSDDTAFSVLPGQTALSLDPAPALVAPNAAETLSAVLTDGLARPVAEQTVVFVVRGAETQVRTAITDYAGRAALGPLPLPPGSYQVEATFGQSVNPGVPFPTVGSPNPVYSPASSNGSLVVDSGVPTAGDDEVTGRAGLPMKIAITSLLSNDSDPDGDPLTLDSFEDSTGEAVGVTRSGPWLLLGPLPAGVGADAFRYTVSDPFGKTSSARVVIRIDPDQSPSSNIDGITIEDGLVRLRFFGIPGRTYRIQYSPATSPLAWVDIGTAMVAPDGVATFVGPDLGAGSGLYRTAYP